MIAIIRIIAIFFYFVFVCVGGCLYSMLRPFHSNTVHIMSRALGKVAWLLGVEVEIRMHPGAQGLRRAVYVANHQNSLDMFFISNAVQPHTVTLGKKSIRWIPLFGQLYWFSGNILIDRSNRDKAHNTINQTVEKNQKT